MRLFLLLFVNIICSVKWVNGRNLVQSTGEFNNNYSPPRRMSANTNYGQIYQSAPDNWGADDFFSNIQNDMNSMFQNILSSLDAMSDGERQRRPSDWFADSDESQSDEIIRKILRDIAAPSPSQPRRPQPLTSSSSDTLFRRTQVTRPGSSSSSNQGPVYSVSSNPVDDFLGYWDREFRQRFMSILTELSKALDDDSDSDETIAFPRNNPRSTPRSTPKSTPKTPKSTPQTPRSTPKSRPEDDTVSDGKSVETSSSESDDSRDTIDAGDGEIEVSSSSSSGWSSSTSTYSTTVTTPEYSYLFTILFAPWILQMPTTVKPDQSQISDTNAVTPSVQMDEENTKTFTISFDGMSTSDSIGDSGSNHDITTQDYSLIDVTTSSQGQSEIAQDTENGPIDGDSIQSDGDVKTASESSDWETGETTEFKIQTTEINENSQSSEVTESEPMDSDVSVSSTDVSDDQETSETNTDKKQSGEKGTAQIDIESSADLPSTTIDSVDEIVVPEISMPKYDTDFNANKLDDIEIHVLPTATTSHTTVITPDQADDEKTTKPTSIGDDEQGKSVDIHDNEISSDDGAQRKPWEHPLGRISINRFLKKVVDKIDK